MTTPHEKPFFHTHQRKDYAFKLPQTIVTSFKYININYCFIAAPSQRLFDPYDRSTLTRSIVRQSPVHLPRSLTVLILPELCFFLSILQVDGVIKRKE